MQLESVTTSLRSPRDVVVTVTIRNEGDRACSAVVLLDPPVGARPAREAIVDGYVATDPVGVAPGVTIAIDVPFALDGPLRDDRFVLEGGSLVVDDSEVISFGRRELDLASPAAPQIRAAAESFDASSTGTVAFLIGNEGLGALRDAELTIALPAPLQFVDLVVSSPDGTVRSGVLRDVRVRRSKNTTTIGARLDEIPAQQTVALVRTLVRAAAPCPAEKVSIVAARLQGDGLAATATADVLVTASPRIDAGGSSIRAGARSGRCGEAVDVTVTLRNDGHADAADATVLIPIPDGARLTFADAPAAITIDDGRRLEVPVARIGVGETVVLRGRLALPEALTDRTVVGLRATVVVAGFTIPLAGDEIVVRSAPDVVTSFDVLAPLGAPLRYRETGRVAVTVANRGSDVASGVTVTLDLPDVLGFDGSPVVAFGDLAPGAQERRVLDLVAGEYHPADAVAIGLRTHLGRRLVAAQSVEPFRFAGEPRIVAAWTAVPGAGDDVEDVTLRLRNVGDGRAADVVVCGTRTACAVPLVDSLTLDGRRVIATDGSLEVFTPHGLVVPRIGLRDDVLVRWSMRVLDADGEPFAVTVRYGETETRATGTALRESEPRTGDAEGVGLFEDHARERLAAARRAEAVVEAALAEVPDDEPEWEADPEPLVAFAEADAGETHADDEEEREIVLADVHVHWRAGDDRLDAVERRLVQIFGDAVVPAQPLYRHLIASRAFLADDVFVGGGDGASLGALYAAMQSEATAVAASKSWMLRRPDFVPGRGFLDFGTPRLSAAAASFVAAMRAAETEPVAAPSDDGALLGPLDVTDVAGAVISLDHPLELERLLVRCMVRSTDVPLGLAVAAYRAALLDELTHRTETSQLAEAASGATTLAAQAVLDAVARAGRFS